MAETAGSGGMIQPQGFPPLPEDWTSEWETFQSADLKTQLFGILHHKKEWKTPRALLVFHGMGEHGGRYLHVPHYVQGEVDAVYCLDHRGHGRSEGIRGHAEDWNMLVEDAAKCVRRLDEKLKRRFGKSEIHLLAHSLGGLIGLRMLQLHPGLPLCSATISAPFLGIHAKVPVAKKMAALVLSKLWGSLQLSTELDASLVSHDPEVVRCYQVDRLVHDKMTPLFFSGLQKAFKATLSKKNGIHVPIQILVPLEDQIVDKEKTLGFYRQLEHEQKQLRTYPGFFHEPLNETGKEKVFADIVEWMHRHRGGAGE